MEEQFINREHFADTDSRPGSSENSPEYDRRYNPRGRTEFTNLAEQANEEEALRLLQEHDEFVRSGLRSSEFGDISRVQYWPDVGRFIIPKENTFAAHLQLVRKGENLDIQFDPATYAYFDQVLVNAAGRPDLFDPRHKDYMKYISLRENLAVLRNDIMGIYMEDGSFNPGDEKYLPRLVRIATDIGEALCAEKRPTGFLAPRLSSAMMNVEGEGAAYVYEFLEKRQSSNTFFGRIWAKLMSLVSQPPRRLGLPPIEHTALSREKLDLLPSEDDLCNLSPNELTSHCYALLRGKAEEGKLPREQVDILSLMEKREAIDHGHIILDWLKNIKFSNKSLTEWMSTGSPIDRTAERHSMQDIVNSWNQVIEGLTVTDSNVLNIPSIQEADDVIKTLEHSIQIMAKLEQAHSKADAMQIGVNTGRRPQRWNELSRQPVNRLMTIFKAGLKDALNILQQQEESMERLQEEQIEKKLAAAHAYYQKRSKSKTKRKDNSDKKGEKQRKLDQSIRADDYALKQGVFAERDKDTPQAKSRDKKTSNRSAIREQEKLEHMKRTLSELDKYDPEIIRQLGKTLLEGQVAGQQAKANLESNNKGNNGISPDDKNFAARQQQLKELDENRPRRS